VGLAGCETGQPQTHDHFQAGTAADDQFEAGADLPPTPRTLHAMATMLAAHGRDEPAVYVLTRLLNEHPQFLPAYCDLAEVHARHGRVEQAISALQSGRRVAPDDAVIASNLGLCWMLQSDYAKALEQFDQAVALAPDNALFHANRATALGLLGRDEECLRAYAQVLPPDQARHNLRVLREARQKLTGEPAQATLAGEPAKAAPASPPAQARDPK
jgi:Flp pilus assembly protein TadD